MLIHLPEYDLTQKYMSISNYSMHYIDEGAGELILMLHGNPTWSFYYRRLINDLKSEYRVIAPDYIGCGLSDKPSTNTYSYTLKQRVDDLTLFLQQLNIQQKITLILHDWGGMIGMLYAMQHPENIKRFIVFNTAAFRLPETKSFPFVLQLARTWLGAFLILYCNAFAKGTAYIGCKRKRMSKVIREGYCYPYDSPAHRIALLEFVKDIPLNPNDVSYELVLNVEKNLHIFSHLPMLICWGMKDIIFDYHFLNVWKKNFPNAHVFQFNDCGHYILEDAYEEIIPLVKKFLLETDDLK